MAPDRDGGDVTSCPFFPFDAARHVRAPDDQYRTTCGRNTVTVDVATPPAAPTCLTCLEITATRYEMEAASWRALVKRERSRRGGPS